MRRLTIILPLLMLGLLVQAQPDVSTIDVNDKRNWDTLHVEDLLTAALSSMDTSSPLNIEKAIEISNIIDYELGKDKSFKQLIQYYDQADNGPGELTTRIRYDDYLKKLGEESKPEKANKIMDMRAWNTMQTAHIYFDNELYREAIETYETADSFAAVGNDDYLVHEINIRLAQSYMMEDKPDLAVQIFEDELAESKKRGLKEEALWINQQLAKIASSKGEFKRAFDISLANLELANEYGLAEEAQIAINNLGFAARFLEEEEEEKVPYSRALGHFEEALSKSNANDNPFLEAEINQSMGIIYQNRKEFKLAIESLEKAETLYKNQGKHYEQANVLGLLARIYSMKGETVNALYYSNKAIELSWKGKNRKARARAIKIRSEVHESLYDYTEALNDFREYLKIEDSIRIDEIRKEERLSATRVSLLSSASSQMSDLARIDILKKENELVIKEKDLAAAEKLRAEKEKIALEKENAFKNEQLRSQRLELEKQEERLRVVEAQREIRNKDAANAILAAEKLEQEKDLLEKEKELREEEEENRKAKLRIAEEERFQQQLIFGLGGLAVMIVLVGFVAARMRSQRNQIAEQNDIISQNQKVIEKEKEKSDKLLLNILPPAVATELKEKGNSAPRNYDEVSVLFTDFKGFTNISEKLTASELVKKLDELFLQFDLIAEKHGLSRIKTIGDAYMAAAGLPEEDPDNARNAVNAALDIRDYMQTFNEALSDDEPHWQIRIGVNTGPVVAGVVGIRKFAYDIWGDTVNTASRMESSGVPGKVNVSGATYATLKDQFNFEYRGKVQAKNKGEIDMYFAERA